MIRIGGSIDVETCAADTTGQLPTFDTLRYDQQGTVAMFDLSDCTWGSFYDTNALAYEEPTKIVERIGRTWVTRLYVYLSMLVKSGLS